MISQYHFTQIILLFLGSTRQRQTDINASMHRATLFAIGALLLFAIETPVRAAPTIPVTNTNESSPGHFGPALNGALPPNGVDGFVSEYFDNVTPPELPIGWIAINAIDPDGILWVTSDSGDPQPPADSPPNAAFINDPDAISDKYLYSPPIAIVPVGTSFLEFRHNYNLEASDVDPNLGFDGGVLEVSVDGGPFQDLGGSILSGGYNRTISTDRGSPIAGRQAWSGDSGGFITTLVDVSFNGHTIVLRWRMASDESTSSEGWRIDSVYIFGERPTPTPTPFPSITPTPTPTLTPTATPPFGTPTPPPPTPTLRPSPTPRSRPTPLPRPTPP